MNAMNFSSKLFVSFLLLGFIGLSFSAGSSYLSTKEILRQNAVDRLIAIRDNRAKIVEYYFSQKRSQVQLLAKTLEVVQAAEKFGSGFQALENELNLNDITRKKIDLTLGAYYRKTAKTYPVHRPDPRHDHDYSFQPRMLPDSTEGKILQTIYTLRSNFNGINNTEKQNFAYTTYSKTHKKYHPLLEHHLRQFHFYDFFIIDSATGIITYSVKKEIDYGTSLLKGPYRQTNLAKIFSDAQQRKEPSALFVDFEHYVPSNDHPASFLAYPIYSNNKQVGIFAAQLSIEELNNVLTDDRQWDAAGLGQTGETYLVGYDGFMRNDSRFLLEALYGDVRKSTKQKIPHYVWKKIPIEKTTVLHQHVNSNTFHKAVSGNIGVDTSNDYREVEVISAFRPVKIPGVDWILLAEMDTEEIFHDLYKFKVRCVLVSLVFLILVILFSYYMAHIFSRPIKKLVTDIGKFGSKTLDYRINLTTKDEFSDISNAFNDMADGLQKKTVSLDYFDMIVTSMTDILLVVDITEDDSNALIKDVNQAACQILEYDRKDLVNLPFKKIFSDHQDPEIFTKNKLSDITDTGSVRGVEKTYLTKSGREIPVLFSVSVLVDKSGATKGFITIAQEISELKAAKVQMQEQIQFLSLGKDIGLALRAGKNLQEMLHQCCELLVDYLDAAFARIWLLNDNQDTLILQGSAGMHIIDEKPVRPLHDDDKIGRIALRKTPYLMNNIIDSPHVHYQEWKKKEKMFSFAGHPLLLEGKVIGVIAIFSLKTLSEISIRAMAGVADEIALGVQWKLAEGSLLASEKMHREAQEIAHIGHWELNLMTNELKWSDEMYKIFEITRGKFGASYEAFLDLVHPDDREAVDNAYPKSIKNRTKYDMIHRIVCGTGCIKYLHERSRTEYDENGTPLYFLGTTQDITALKKAEIENEKIESRLRQAQKMEAIGTLAGGIAHDFNNVLNAIIGYSDILLMDLPLENQHRNNVIQINNAGRRATKLVRQILTFSRRTEQERQPIQPHLIVKEVLKLLRSSLPTTIEIRQDIGVCGSVIADSTQLHQIVMNLCTNAFHAMEDGKGVLEVRLKEIDVDQHLAEQTDNLSEGRYVCLSVRDTGAGIDKITMSRIFEPYFTTKKKGEGTGLGLSTVHGIVLSHGGGISVQSETGQGTTFNIFFPIADIASVQPQKEKVTKKLPQLNGRILFIDDVEFNVQLGIHICSRLGCGTKGVTNSLEALAVFRKAPADFDIIITDQTMPNLTGFELAVEMLKIRSDIPIIMVTGHSDIVDEEKAKEVGIRDFLTKPLDVYILAEAIGKILL
ncbi:MAG: PAS domain S-box protein [Candidatus Electrothrix sp. AR4]|nr:PAS domain S-box protein [Candidatus Electrothrix sp. AR4]